MEEKIKLNYGCGETKLEGFVNVDIEESTKPDKIADLRKGPLPFEDKSCEKIHMIHSLEHVERHFWPQFFAEFNRVLVDDGLLILAYPEFERCAQYFIENYRGMRDFWRATLYGRQLYPGDYHVVPMRTEEVILSLEEFGFYDVKFCPEPDQEFNTFLVAKKRPNSGKPQDRASILKNEIFDDFQHNQSKYKKQS